MFGIQQRPLSNSTNDINASSEFSLDGTVEIDNPAVDPATGLIDLSASVGNTSDQISQNPCQQGVGSEFIVTGQGGLPRNPTDSLSSNEVQVGLVEPLLGQGEGEIRRQGARGDKGDKGQGDETRRKYHYGSSTCNGMGI